MREKKDNQKYIILITNISVEPFFSNSVKLYYGNDVSVVVIQYGQLSMERIKHYENVIQVLIWMNIEVLCPDMLNYIMENINEKNNVIEELNQFCVQMVHKIKELFCAPIVWLLFEDYYLNLYHVTGHVVTTASYVDILNNQFSSIFAKDITIIDLKYMIACNGVYNVYDYKNKYRWNMPYKSEFINQVVMELHKMVLIESGKTKKCLVLDCDNVLWGGIVSEVGVDNIELGSIGPGRKYMDFQRYVLSLYNHGVILVICSRNDEKDVKKIFKEHNEMILKEKHIAYFSVNWNDKPQNILLITKTLNIGLDSIVFVDDSVNEVESVKYVLPEVKTILFNFDNIYKQLSCFNLKSNNDIALIDKRNKTYQTINARDELRLKCRSYKEYLTNLEVKLDIHVAEAIEYNRISQLSKRTNKYTNGNRYSIEQIYANVKNYNESLCAVYLSDKFVDMGLVGAFEVIDHSLTLICLSCRTIGLSIEERVIDYIKNIYNIKTVFFKDTGSNNSFKDILQKNFSLSNVEKQT